MLIVCEVKTSNANRQWDHKFANKISIDSLSRSQSFACRSAPSRQPSAALSGVWCVHAPKRGERSREEWKISRFNVAIYYVLPKNESWVSVSPLLSKSFGARWNETKSETTWNWHVPEHKMQSLLNFDSSHSTSSFLKFLSLDLSRFHMHTFVVSCYDLRLLGCDSCEYKLCTQNGINYSCLEISISIHEKKIQRTNERTERDRVQQWISRTRSFFLFHFIWYLPERAESCRLPPAPWQPYVKTTTQSRGRGEGKGDREKWTRDGNERKFKFLSSTVRCSTQLTRVKFKWWKSQLESSSAQLRVRPLETSEIPRERAEEQQTNERRLNKVDEIVSAI